MPAMAAETMLDLNKIQNTNIKLYESTLYIAFSKETSDDEILRWQQALDQLKLSGLYQKLYLAYIQPDLP